MFVDDIAGFQRVSGKLDPASDFPVERIVFIPARIAVESAPELDGQALLFRQRREMGGGVLFQLRSRKQLFRFQVGGYAFPRNPADVVAAAVPLGEDALLGQQPERPVDALGADIEGPGEFALRIQAHSRLDRRVGKGGLEPLDKPGGRAGGSGHRCELLISSCRTSTSGRRPAGSPSARARRCARRRTGSCCGYRRRGNCRCGWRRFRVRC